MTLEVRAREVVSDDGMWTEIYQDLVQRRALALTGVCIFGFCHLPLVTRRDSSVTTVIKLRDDPGFEIPGGGEIIFFYLFHNIPTGCGPT
jgi:hypothetical protein